MNDSSRDLNVNPGSDPVGVPVFNCVVYVAAVTGGVRARVMNFEGIEITAASERSALSQIVPAFKKRIAELMQAGRSLPWIEPVPELQPGEEQRLIPVHL